MKKYIVDASVVIKSLLSEQSKTAVYFKNIFKDEVYSIDFLKSEVANGLRFSIGDSDTGARFFEKFLNLPIKYLSLTKVQHEQTLKLSYELGTTVYDTSYHVLALAKNMIFMTSDKRYFNSASRLGFIELI